MSITLRGELSQSRNADIRAMETRNCTALVTTVGIIMKGMRMMARSEMAGKTISGVSSCPRMWYRRSTTAIMTGGVASLMNDVSTRQTCTPLRYCSSMSRFASMFAMKRGSHVINFAMRNTREELVRCLHTGVSRGREASPQPHHAPHHKCIEWECCAEGGDSDQCAPPDESVQEKNGEHGHHWGAPKVHAELQEFIGPFQHRCSPY
ncbi:hypothetical protein C3747_379g2 [Trypanosoma cruzi]|uniref:Uncharacterized protein n=1 Tax=Trypanosoma cruzi TaxID=5693 RepID=A0A2V2V1B5_TRYCR|nr:hypothetical protein C3747_379g2 [Trypanosoma cruzi]